MLLNCSLSASGATAELIVSIPNISIAKPIRIVPISFFLLDFDIIIKKMPIIASIGVKDVGLSSCIKMLSPCIPVSDNSHDVIVVPILAPIITPIACDSRIIPEFTKPTTITVVADDDWITAVTKAPSMMALKGLEVIFSRIRSRRLPDSFSRPCPIAFIPNRNSASPPTIVRMPKISIVFLSRLVFF